jgi:hypothetical protein
MKFAIPACLTALEKVVCRFVFWVSVTKFAAPACLTALEMATVELERAFVKTLEVGIQTLSMTLVV